MARAEAALVTDDARLLNRELSWLDYNARVLARAVDTALPLRRTTMLSFCVRQAEGSME